MEVYTIESIVKINACIKHTKIPKIKKGIGINTGAKSEKIAKT